MPNYQFLDFGLEIKAVSVNEDNTIGIFEGYGSIFGNKDSYGDVVEPGAFVESLKSNGMPAMLWQHNTDTPIGVYSQASEDSKGLYLKGEINLKVQAGLEAYELIKQGAVKGLSIGFITEADEIDRNSGVRRLKKVRLMEVSLVTFPANKLAKVTAWKGELPRTEREFDKFLQAAGFSRKDAKTIGACGFKAYLSHDQRDADDGADQEQRDAATIEHSLKSLLTNLTGV